MLQITLARLVRSIFTKYLEYFGIVKGQKLISKLLIRCIIDLGSYSRITMQLVLTRKITYHLFRTYLPSGLFVIIGWFSLFIPIDHVPGRVTMGMTTILTLAAMFSAMATTTPRISYRFVM